MEVFQQAFHIKELLKDTNRQFWNDPSSLAPQELNRQ